MEFRSILEPARRRLRDVRVIEGSAESVDWESRQVSCVGAVGGGEVHACPTTVW